jgi:hypothetical protein
MSALTIAVTLAGMGEADMVLHEMRNALARRGPLHAQMAVRGKQFTQEYLRGLNRHRSAERLGASPTGWHAKAAALVEAHNDDDEARVTIPRSTGLGRAFGDVVIRPGNGRKYLTIPAHVETYGRSVRDFPEEAFRFTVIQSWRTFLALTFRETAGRHKKGEVAYWLKREIKQRQDRTLLPSDEGYAKVARGAAVEYLMEIIDQGRPGPIGGTSTGMPAA